MVGATVTTQAESKDTLLDIARQYGLGYEEITNANPGVDPMAARRGHGRRRAEAAASATRAAHRHRDQPAGASSLLVLRRRRPARHRSLWSFPVSIGKMDWNTPLGRTTIVSKAKDARGYRRSRSARSMRSAASLFRRLFRGPDNPMGRYKMALGVPGGAYLIHGTNRPAGIGMQVTHGCMRLYPEDIETLYGMVPVGTQVTIVNQPSQVGLGATASS